MTLPQEFAAAFDLVLVTIGVISWMPDLQAFFEVARGLLKPGGQLVMEEMHPVLFMYEEDPQSGVSKPRYSYFGDQVWEETSGLDYYGHEVYESRAELQLHASTRRNPDGRRRLGSAAATLYRTGL